MSRLFLGVEIGGTKQQIAVCDESGQIVEMIAERVPHENSASDIQAWIKEKSAVLLDRYPEIVVNDTVAGGYAELKLGRHMQKLSK